MVDDDAAIIARAWERVRARHGLGPAIPEPTWGPRRVAKADEATPKPPRWVPVDWHAAAERVRVGEFKRDVAKSLSISSARLARGMASVGWTWEDDQAVSELRSVAYRAAHPPKWRVVAADRKAKRQHRDQAIVEMADRGAKPAEIAVALSMLHWTVRSILRREKRNIVQEMGNNSTIADP